MTQIGAPLGLIKSLARELNDRGVKYCHWKSNATIDRALAGEGDLDLLIGRDSIGRFDEVMASLRFTRADAKGRADVPGTEHFYGYDEDADAFVHIHAHYQMILGHDRTKNYHLPIEEAYLRASRQQGLLHLPDPNFEYVVFVIRMILKYSTWDEILWNALLGRSSRPKPAERAEFQTFQERVDDGTVSKLLGEHLPYVEASLFQDCVDILQSKTSIPRRLLTVHRLQQSLSAHGRYAPAVDVGLRLWRRVAVTIRKRLGGAPSKRLATGGAIIAVIGGDGSGKSTALDEVHRWLASEFDVRRIHLGKPRWSITTVLVRGILQLLAAIAGAGRTTRPDASRKNLVERYRPVFWMVCKARDRFHTYRKARRFTTNGGLVVSDRYPHPSLRIMDAPQIEGMLDENLDGPFVRRMMRIEQKYHQAIGLPELVVALRLDPEIAVLRKTTESAESVRRRGTEIWQMTWEDGSVHVIDASKSKEDVARELKSLIWSRLS
jgi:thymidylate kinase